MLLYLLQFDSLNWVGLQHSIDQITHFIGDVVGQEIATLFDFGEQQGQLVVIKRKAATDHRIQDHTA